jgi:hypothetical protein
MREAPGLDGQDQRCTEASGRSCLVPETTIGRFEFDMRRNDAALPALLVVSLVDQPPRHDFSLSRSERGDIRESPGRRPDFPCRVHERGTGPQC